MSTELNCKDQIKKYWISWWHSLDLLGEFEIHSPGGSRVFETKASLFVQLWRRVRKMKPRRSFATLTTART